MNALELLDKNENRELNVRIISYVKGVTGKWVRQVIVNEITALTNINRSLSKAFDNLTLDLARERARNINLLAEAERRANIIQVQNARINSLLNIIEEYDNEH